MWHSEFPSSRESDDNSHVGGEAVRRRRLARALTATPWMTPARRWVLIVRCKGGGHGKRCDGSESMNGNVWNVGGLMSRETPGPSRLRFNLHLFIYRFYFSFHLTFRVDLGGRAGLMMAEKLFFFFQWCSDCRDFKWEHQTIINHIMKLRYLEPDKLHLTWIDIF